MRLAGSRSCRRFTWLLILAFSLFSTPHSGLCLLCLADLLVSAAYAGEQAETRPPQGDDAQQAPPQMMMAGSGGTAGSMTGALSPSINVSPFAGTATAAIPIEVPPGRKGMAPKLALNYSSQQGSGWIGMGWTIDLGAIQRSTKRGTSYTTNNYVAAINGSSAELVPRADWGTNHYGARIEGTLSRYYYNTATGGWEVASKDGTRYYYGSTQASRQDATSWQVGTKVFAWRLDKVIDTNGNYMTVSYTKDQGEIYPYRIDYTCNAAAGLSATNSVKFYLEPRTDVPVMFTTSYQVKTAKRLKTIEVKSGGARVRAYRLTYVTSASTSRSLLASVQMFGSDATVNASGTITGGSGLPPVTLRYDETKTHSFTAGPDGVYIPNTYGYTYPFFTFGDFNGDNKTDVIYHRMNGTWMVVFSNGDGTFTPGPEILIPNVDTYGSPHFSFGDFNADGKTDIIHLTTGGLWRVLLSQGNGTFIPGPDVAIPDVDSYCSPHFSFVDINGDGKTDIIYLIKNTNAWRVLFSNGNGTFTPGPDVAIPNVNTYGYPHFSFGDFNADGKADIIHLTTGGLWRVLLSQGNGTFIPGPDVAIPGPYSYSSPFWSYADFNGDGKTDIIYHTTGGTWKVMFSNGDGAFTASSGVSIPGPYSYSYPFWHYGDFNGDGKADIISLTTGNAWVVYFSNGNGTFTAGSGTIIPNAYQHAYPFWSYADFNGDGRTDIFYHTLSSAWAMRLSDSGGDLLVSITNGLGGTTSLSYTPSSAYQNTYLPFIVWTVSQITQDDGRGQSYATRYAYTGGWFDPIEREFMGFRYAPSYQMRDASTYESVTETWYHQDITRKGMIEAERTTSFEGHTRQVNNTWTIRNVQNSSGNPISTVTYPSLDTTVSSITDSGYTPYTYAIDYVYDPIYLNVIREYKSGATEEEDVDTSFAYTNYTGPWIIAKPTEVKVKDHSGNIKSAKWMTYHPTTGNLLTEEVCKSDNPSSECVNSNPTQNPVVTYQYTTEGNVSSVTDPLNHPPTTYTYDATKTFVYETVNAAGHITRTVYNPGTGRLISLTPPHLQGTAYAITNQYDVFGRLIQETRPDGGYTTYLYANLGNPASQFVEKKEHITGGASPIDHYSDAFFDGLGRTYRVWSNGPEGKTIALDTHYDVIGRVSHRSNPYYAGIDTPVYTTLQYDGLSRVTHTTSPDGGQVITSYQGLTKQVRDQMNHWSASTYDVHNRLRVTQDPNGITTLYTYDTLGNLIQVIAAYGQAEQNVTSMTYDSLGKKRSMTDPDMGTWTYTYDKAGNLFSQTDAKGQPIAFTYDAINRLISKVYPTHTVTYTYDDPSIPYSKGMLTSTLDPSGGETKEDRVLAFDLMQRATQSQKTIGAASLTISKTYDTSGRTLTMTYGTNPQRSYGYVYDVAGNTVGLWDYTLNTYHVQYSGHTPSGQPTVATFPKPNNISIRTLYTYDPYTMRLDTLITERLQGQNPVATLQNLTYDYDLKGNITTLTDTVNTITHAYAYDALDRLITANGTGSTPYSHTYAYDVIGNITSKSDVGSYTYLYGNKPHAVRQAGNLSFQYDPNGNMTQRYDGGTSVALDLTWNHDNKPSVISRRVGGGPSQPYLTFTYDGNSQRVKKYNHFTGATTLYFGEVYEIRNEEPIIHLFANNQRIVSIQADGRMGYYHGNHLHSASVITDGYGNTKEAIEYHPYGTYRLRTDLDASFPNVNYTFTDQEEDDEAGLYNYKARLYDPLLGRFISADSIVPEPGNLQAYNRYSYCLNNPVVYTDPSGQFSLGDVFNAFITGVVAAVAFWATGGTGTPGITTFIAGITAGAAGGATASALSGGNLQGILQGAVMGAAIGGLTGGLLGGIGAEYGASAMQWAGYGVMAAGGGAAYASGGLDGLAYYAAGMLGAMAGGYGAQYVKENWFNNPKQSVQTSLPRQIEKKLSMGLIVDVAAESELRSLNPEGVPTNEYVARYELDSEVQIGVSTSKGTVVVGCVGTYKLEGTYIKSTYPSGTTIWNRFQYTGPIEKTMFFNSRYVPNYKGCWLPPIKLMPIPPYISAGKPL